MRWIVVIWMIAGCGSLVDGDYAGEPMLRLQGVAGARQTKDTTAGAKAAALWQGPGAAGAVRFTRLPLENDFPAFWIDVLALPRDDATLWLGAGEPVFAEAYLHIIRGDVGPQPRRDDFLATDYEHVLVWISDAMPADGLTASYFGAALTPGFHVVTRRACTELTTAQQAMVARCVELSTDLPPDRALGTCTAQHLYQLAPAADDLDTLLTFRVEQP
jgi:hypothetical protein